LAVHDLNDRSRHNSFPFPGRIATIPTRRFVSIAACVVIAVVVAPWIALTWDAHLANFQVRWMCDEDRPFVLRTRNDAELVAIPDEALADPRVLPLFSEAFPTVTAASTPQGRVARYALVDKWPRRVRSYWGYAVVRSELSVVERPGDRAMATSGLYKRVPRLDAPFAELRARLAPPPELCTPADRIEFVKRVIRPPA
jgi:hypothetical protein